MTKYLFYRRGASGIVPSVATYCVRLVRVNFSISVTQVFTFLVVHVTRDSVLTILARRWHFLHIPFRDKFLIPPGASNVLMIVMPCFSIAFTVEQEVLCDGDCRAEPVKVSF